MRFNPETKTFKVFTALYNGEKLTPAAAEKRFGVKNLSAEASRIRVMQFMPTAAWLATIPKSPNT